MRVLQANMHRSKTADAILSQLILEHDADLVIVNEPYSRKDGMAWLEDNTATAVIWVPGSSQTMITSHNRGTGFVCARTMGVTFISCYLTPSDDIHAFQAKLDDIEQHIVQGATIIAGDFNSRAVEWGMRTTNSKGRRILDMAARNHMLVVNTGATTFRRPGCEHTTPDLTLASDAVASRVTNWRVLEEYTGSDHQYIVFSVAHEARRPPAPNNTPGARKWIASKLNVPALLTATGRSAPSPDTFDARTAVANTMHCIRRACNAAMPKCGSGRKRKQAVYWWNEDIAQLRRECLRCRRRLTRTRRRDPAIADADDYRQARKRLKAAIASAKKEKWEQLRADVNKDPWGLGYKLVMKKLGTKTPAKNMDENTMRNIVETLFPTHPTRPQSPDEPQAQTLPPPFTEEELQAAAQSLKNRKAPGPDQIPAEVLKAIAHHNPQLLLPMYNACLRQGLFPETWKKQRLVLISKGKGEPATPAAYRPLCMLDTAGKLLEKMLKPRLAAAIEASGGLSPRQHGFRAGKSTLGAIQEVIHAAEESHRGNHFSRPVVLLVTLDVRNAFNSLRWTTVLEALSTRHQVPAYLLKMMGSYLQDRELIYETNAGQKTFQITAGAAQGSVLGPEIWNISYDGIFRIPMPDDTFLVGYADDIAAVITARNTEEAQRKLTQVMIRTQMWLNSHGLQLATQKTELLLLTRRHINVEMEMRVSNEVIKTQKAVKYLGITLDPKLTYWAQIQQAATKAAKATSALSRLMANVGGPTAERRRLLMTVTNAILLYGSELWAHSLTADTRRKELAKVQRTAALRIASAYRTVSGAAIEVIAGVIPIDILAFERNKLWNLRVNEDLRPETAAQERQHAIARWQSRWDAETRGRWTAKLIPRIEEWLNRRRGEVSYYMTQFLSGHGYFRKYLNRLGKAGSPNCIYGDAEEDDAKHTFFECRRWEELRRNLERCTGPLSTERVQDILCSDEEKWHQVAAYVECILKKKKMDLDAEDTSTGTGTGIQA